jgi:hypothetical protein
VARYQTSLRSLLHVFKVIRFPSGRSGDVGFPIGLLGNCHHIVGGSTQLLTLAGIIFVVGIVAWI